MIEVGLLGIIVIIFILGFFKEKKPQDYIKYKKGRKCFKCGIRPTRFGEYGYCYVCEDLRSGLT